ncbi:MAG: winged helix DNA-binding domain-containing protein, partial [Alphaproteobacteria bacterium]|nr:winged helix DNA-binding domain-containing protein [Alphaproteobacteria bacterium]
MTILVPNAAARRLFLHLQGLSAPPNRKLTRPGLLGLIEGLGFVQVDSINTVERAHHMILFARNQTYAKADLARLLERDRALFENWTHDASIIPTAFFPYWEHRFACDAAGLRARWREWRREGFEHMLDDILDHVRREGPSMARHLRRPQDAAAEGWWDWHPSKTALEYLWRTGALAVDRREGFQKVYDLAERVIPAAHRGVSPAHEDFVDWFCRGALDRLGIATAGEIAAFWDAVTPDEAKAWCADRLGGELVEVLVEPADGSKPRLALARSGILERAAAAPEPPGRLRVLSPFDPLIRDRARARRLFGFDYRIEVFVPAAKRTYGYYVFPLLEGDRLIGRIDMKCERGEGLLRVTGLWLESGIKPTAARRR